MRFDAALARTPCKIGVYVQIDRIDSSKHQRRLFEELGKDRARSFEYALGSARESVDWYHAVKPVLGEEIVTERTNVLGDIRRLLVAIIPRERTRIIRPQKRLTKLRKRPA